MTYVGIILTFIFANNIILTQLLGVCAFMGISRDIRSSVGAGIAITLVSTLATLTTWAVYHGVLLPLGLSYLQTPAFILVITGLLMFLEKILKAASAGLFMGIGQYLPLIVTNCAVFGITLIAIRNDYNALESIAGGFAAGLGYLLALVLISSLRDSLRKEWIPKPFQGLPITFISAGLMAMAFMAFDHALLKNLIG